MQIIADLKILRSWRIAKNTLTTSQPNAKNWNWERERERNKMSIPNSIDKCKCAESSVVNCQAASLLLLRHRTAEDACLPRPFSSLFYTKAAWLADWLRQINGTASWATKSFEDSHISGIACIGASSLVHQCRHHTPSALPQTDHNKCAGMERKGLAAEAFRLAEPNGTISSGKVSQRIAANTKTHSTVNWTTVWRHHNEKYGTAILVRRERESRIMHDTLRSVTC